MAYADPQSITIASATIPLARVYTGTEKGKFVSSDGATSVEIVPTSNSSRLSRVVRLYQRKTTADPLVGSTNIRVGDMVSLTINRPLEGYSDDEILDQVTGFITWLTADTNANLNKLIAGEN